VLDPAGAAVVGASVTLTNEGTKGSFTAQTGEGGTYVFDSVQVGVYSVTVEAQGFKKFFSDGNRVNVNQPATVNVTLEVGNISDVVTVNAAAEAVQTSSSGNFGNTVDQRTLETLPIVGNRGRNPLTFILLQPGVSETQGITAGGGIHVHGSRDRAFNYTLDGIDSNESSFGGSNLSPIRTNPDSITQFQVVTSNFTAELGRSSGAQVTLVTRSGTNQFHGTGFWFYQTPGVNANEYGNKINTRLVNGQFLEQPRGQFIQHIFGGSLGGPIVKDKLFFFTNLQLLRSYDTALVTRTVYTAQARAGLYRYRNDGVANAPAGAAAPSVDTRGNVIVPAASISTYNIGASDPLCVSAPTNCGLDPTIRTLIGSTPLPNNFAVGDGLNTAGFNYAAPQREKQYDFTAKVDYTITNKSTLYVRYAQGEQNTFGDSANGGRPAFPDSTSNLVDTYRNPKNLAINYRWAPTERITNEFVIGGNRYAFSFNNPDPNANTNPPFTFSNSGITDPLNSTPPINNLRRITTYQLVDNLSYVFGAHTLKGGINFRYQKHEDLRSSVGGFNTNKSVNFAAPTPGASFNLPASPAIQGTDRTRLIATLNDMLGRVGAITQSFVAQGDGSFAPAGTLFNFDARYAEYDFYLQDSWKVRPNLMFDYGLRWEPKLAPRAAGDTSILVPDHLMTAGAAPSNTVKWVNGKQFDDDWNNFSPSVGLAWDPFKDGKTSVRVNYRLAYDRINSFASGSAIFPNTPGTSLGISNTAFGNTANEQGRVRFGIPALSPPSTPAQLRQPIPFSTASITVFDPSFRFPKVNQWGLSLQRDIGKGFVVEANYIGRRGVGLFGGYDANQVDIRAKDPACSESFLDAFITLKSSSSATSCLMDKLLSSDTRRGAATGSAFFRSLFPTQLTQNSVAATAISLSQRLNTNGARTIEASGASPYLFQPFPQFTGAVNVLDSNDFSTYNAMELQLSRRFAQGLSFQVAYTWAKSLDTRSFDPTQTQVSRGTLQSAGATPFDLRNRKLNYARSDFDRRHSLQGYFVYDLPFGHGGQLWKDAPGVVNQVIGGWQLGGIVVWTSGRPFNVYSGSNTVSNAVSSTPNCTGCTPGMGSLLLESGLNFYFSAAQRAMFSIPAPGQQGNLPRNFFDVDGYFDMDLTLSKKFRLNERFNLEFRSDIKNATNHPSFDNPTAVLTSSIFGRIRDSVTSGSRRIQFAMKLDF
jgi:hypothetical protein